MAVNTNATRREFVAGGAALAAGVAAATGAGIAHAAGNGGADPASIAWDYECDVVVMGFGGAGATAAIAASDAGVDTILIEKAPEADAGGNTSASGGFSLYCMPEKRDRAYEYLRFQMPDTITDEEIYGFIDEMIDERQWLVDHGVGDHLQDSESVLSMYLQHEYADGLDHALRIDGSGFGMFTWLKGVVESCENVRVMYETAGTRLIFDPQTKEVYGLVATTADGTEINIKARRGVVMTCGGFENDHHMKTTFYAPNVPIYPHGSPYNTGDGIHMITEIGAKLRGFSSIEWGMHCCKAASEEIGVAVALGWFDRSIWNGAIMVNDQGNRFVNETAPTATSLDSLLRPLHDKSELAEVHFNMETLRYDNLPMFMVLDKKRLDERALFNGAAADSAIQWSHVHDWYTWSDDNQAEVERGWIVEADTLEELAEKLGIDPAGLQATVDAFNAACESGDDAFGREIGMTPIDTPPFYGTELGLGIINTQGGPDRNALHQVLGWDGNPIPRLYSAGEFGSIYVWLYQGSTNVSEALAGRTAGANAAGEEPWE